MSQVDLFGNVVALPEVQSKPSAPQQRTVPPKPTASTPSYRPRRPVAKDPIPDITPEKLKRLAQWTIALALRSTTPHTYDWWTRCYQDAGYDYLEAEKAAHKLCQELPHLFIPAEVLFGRKRNDSYGHY